MDDQWETMTQVQRFHQRVQQIGPTMRQLCDSLARMHQVWGALPQIPEPRALTRWERVRCWLLHPLRSWRSPPRFACLQPGCARHAEDNVCWCREHQGPI